jgi:hypothetical protein
MLESILTGDSPIMAQQKKSTGGDIERRRKNVSVKLSDQELKQLKQMALDTDSTSVAIATEAIRKVLREHFSRRK